MRTDKLYLGDCLEILSKMSDDSIDLVYLDPPFFSEKKHKLKTRDGNKLYSFDDIWRCNKQYGQFLFERLIQIKRVLKNSGSVFFHCDKSAEHIIRAIMDEIFGTDNFQSEIIWCFKRWSNGKRGLLPNHQTIYFYSKTSDFKFNQIFTPYSESTNLDQILQRRRRSKDNKSIYDLDAKGQFKHADKKQGVPLSDVWDIPYLNPKAKERVGYPTQKPLSLLERIIELVTEQNDVILDPFCGSGTTCVAAKLTERKYIGIDQSEEALTLAQTRLDKPIKTESHVLNKGRQAYLNADLSALNLLQGIEFNPVHRNKGIDAILVEPFEGTPVLVKVQKQDESLPTALSLLTKAMTVKKSKKAILLQTQVDDKDPVKCPTGVDIICSPALQLKQQLFVK